MTKRRVLGLSILSLVALANLAVADTTETIRWDGGAHRGPVLSMAWIGKQGLLLSAGADGFVNTWNPLSRSVVDRYQYSPYHIEEISVCPVRSEFILIESDGIGLYRLSAWDYANRRRIFSLRFRDPISFATYSGNGSYLLVGRSASTGITLLNAKDGSLVRVVAETRIPTFVRTGRSEKNLVCYSSSGSVSYWDIATGTEIRSATAPAGLSRLVLFDNNRMIAGISKGGKLIIFDALSGEQRVERVVADTAVPQSSSSGLNIISDYGPEAELIIIDASNPGFMQGKPAIPFPWTSSVVCSDGANRLFFGLDSGSIVALDAASDAPLPVVYEPVTPLKIQDIGVADDGLVVLGGGSLYRLPLIPDSLADGVTISPFAARTEDRVLPLGDRQLLLWNSDGTGSLVYRNSEGDFKPLSFALDAPVNRVATLDGRVLFLDVKGNLSVISPAMDFTVFKYAAVGLLDAAFMSDTSVLVGRSAVQSTEQDLLSIDLRTGETAPFSGSSAATMGTDVTERAVVRLKRGLSGEIYAIRVGGGSANPTTTLVRLDSSGESALISYKAEDVTAMVAESKHSVATTLGGDGAFGIGSSGFFPFQRGPALPTNLDTSGEFYISVDSDGGILWNDGTDGSFIARLTLTATSWELVLKTGEKRAGYISPSILDAATTAPAQEDQSISREKDSL